MSGYFPKVVVQGAKIFYLIFHAKNYTLLRENDRIKMVKHVVYHCIRLPQRVGDFYSDLPSKSLTKALLTKCWVT